MKPYGIIVGTKKLVRATSAGLPRFGQDSFLYEFDDFDEEKVV